MKTQIITLAAHDDLISVRDRMSWAKAPRILLVWPAREQVALQPLDLRILQKHARELGAELGLVARGERILRDARAFGIPVFRSTVEAQREQWLSRGRHDPRRAGSTRVRLARLGEMRERARPTDRKQSSSPLMRMTAFTLAVFSVFAVASLFVPRATIVLTPESREQTLHLAADVGEASDDAMNQAGLHPRIATTRVSGTQSAPVLTRSEVATSKATGVAQFQNLSAGQLVVPAGTVVYSLTPALVRFDTLREVQMDGGANNIVDIPIEALLAGTDGNLPAKSIEGVEGSLSASVSVTNSDPTQGGTSAEKNVPSEGDREKLRAQLEQSLQTQAEAAIQATLEEGDVLLPTTISLQSIEREVWDPPAGQAANLLTLTIDATYEAQYLRGTDLRGLALIGLDSQNPPGFVPREATLRMQVNEISTPEAGQPAQLQLDLQRMLIRRIDLIRANQLVRGETPSRARALLEQSFPLAAPAEIRLMPAWWPWMPLIPFRIEMQVR
jgi:hypothetical protein